MFRLHMSAGQSGNLMAKIVREYFTRQEWYWELSKRERKKMPSFHCWHDLKNPETFLGAQESEEPFQKPERNLFKNVGTFQES